MFLIYCTIVNHTYMNTPQHCSVLILPIKNYCVVFFFQHWPNYVKTCLIMHSLQFNLLKQNLEADGSVMCGRKRDLITYIITTLKFR